MVKCLSAPLPLISLSLLVLLALPVHSEESATISCDFQSTRATGALNDFATFKSCAKSVLFNPNDGAKTLQTLAAAIQPYAFRDIVKNAPMFNGLEHIQVDLDAELASIGSKNYDSDFDFHNTLSSLFLALKDPHTLYVKPTCFGAHLALQPLTLSSKINSITGAQVIFIEGVLSRFVESAPYKGLPLTDLIGATLLKIDGVDAVKALVKFTVTNGYISKDRSASFNQVLKSDFQQRYLGLFDFPSSPTQTYSLKLTNGSIVDITIPWSIYSVNKVRFTPQGCNKALNKVQLSVPKVAAMPGAPQFVDVLKEFKLPAEDAIVLSHASNLDQRRAILDDNVIAQYPSKVPPSTADIAGFVTNDEVITLKISTFSPDDSDGFLDALRKILTYAEANKVKYLTVDLIGNGGGSICLGYQVIHHLTAERFPEGSYDIIKSTVTDNLVRKSTTASSMVPVYGPSFWFDSKRKAFSDDTWYNPGKTYQRGGVMGNYSERVFHACDYDDTFPSHTFDRILILSDGLCGSTCAVFSSHLDEVTHVDTVAIGGITQAPYGMQYYSFPGGQVLELDYIFQIQDYLRLPTPSVPRFPNDATFRFTAVEIYPWLKGKGHVQVPLEFVYRPAQYLIPLWLSSSVDGGRLSQVYDETAKIFDRD